MNFLKEKKPFLEQINFLYYNSAPEALQHIREGIIQGISKVPPEMVSEAVKEENLGFYTVNSPELKMVLINNKNPDTPFFQETNIRKALLQGVNRQWIINNILNSQAIIRGMDPFYRVHGLIMIRVQSNSV